MLAGKESTLEKRGEGKKRGGKKQASSFLACDQQAGCVLWKQAKALVVIFKRTSESQLKGAGFAALIYAVYQLNIKPHFPPSE